MAEVIDLSDKNSKDLLSMIIDYVKNGYAAYPFFSYKPSLKSCDPFNHGNQIVNYFLMYKREDGLFVEVSDSSCNEVLSSHYFDYQCHKMDHVYLLIYANKMQHSHMVSSIYYHMKKFFGEKTEKPEIVELKYTKTYIENKISTDRSSWNNLSWFNRWYEAESKKTMHTSLLAMGFSKNVADSATSSRDYKISADTATEVAMPNFLMLKIPKQYGYSTLSIFTLGIGGKVGLLLDNTKPFDQAIQEFELKRNKLFAKTEMYRRWSTMTRVYKALKGASPTDVFPSYQETKVKSAGYDTVHRKGLLVNRMRRNAPITLDRETFDCIREVLDITNYVRPKFISLLGTKASAEYVLGYMKRYHASLNSVIENMETTLAGRSKRVSKKEVK